MIGSIFFAGHRTLKLIVTDADPIIFKSTEKLKHAYPHACMETLLWNINESPSDELIEKIQHPCLLYERAP
jgi:hypothetical protein